LSLSPFLFSSTAFLRLRKVSPFLRAKRGRVNDQTRCEFEILFDKEASTGERV
jgi:hypothetical protein